MNVNRSIRLNMSPNHPSETSSGTECNHFSLDCTLLNNKKGNFPENGNDCAGLLLGSHKRRGYANEHRH